MEWIALLAVLIVVLILLTLSTRKRSVGDADNPYTRNDILFSAAERSFLGALEQAVGDRYRVFGKVRVADVVSVKVMNDRAEWQRAFNRISAKHFDFLLCAPESLSIKAAIELNDQSHRSRKRVERDQFLLELCRNISLPLIVVDAVRSYSVADLRETIAAEISRDIALEKSVSVMEENDAPMCPRCSAPMVPRRARWGPNAGQEFWGCSAYPKCRGTVPRSA